MRSFTCLPLASTYFTYHTSPRLPAYLIVQAPLGISLTPSGERPRGRRRWNRRAPQGRTDCIGDTRRPRFQRGATGRADPSSLVRRAETAFTLHRGMQLKDAIRAVRPSTVQIRTA